MADKTVAVEETLAAANDSSSRARNMWLGFLGLLAYLFIALASVTHEDLLLNSPVILPIVDVKIPLFSFFMFGPILLFLLHFGLLMQHVSLARKLAAFKEAVKEAVKEAASGSSRKYQKRKAQTHPARLQLHDYSITQYVAGPPNSRVVRSGQWFMGWVTLNFLPIIILLYFQVQFLPYHSSWTWLHRTAILVDLLVLILIGIFVGFPASSLKEAFKHYHSWRIGGLTFTFFGAAVITSISFLVATIPDEPMDKFTSNLWKGFIVTRCGWIVEVSCDRPVFKPTAWFFEGELDKSTLAFASPFSRNLVVALKDLVDDDNKWDEGERSYVLRGRDLKYGQFSGIDLSHADLSYADLTNAIFRRARLIKANLSYATINGTFFKRARLDGAILDVPKGNETTVFSRAILDNAIIDGANLPGVEFVHTSLMNAKFRATITEGPTNLQGANFFDANLQGAYLQKAGLKGANFRDANLQCADLRDADLQGANLRGANLQGADLRGANLQGADLSGAIVWKTIPPRRRTVHEPAGHPLRYASLQQIKFMAPNAKSLEPLHYVFKADEDEAVPESVDPCRARLLNAKRWKAGEDSGDHNLWKEYIGDQSNDSDKVGEFLGNLACGDGDVNDIYAARTIVRRALDVDAHYTKLFAETVRKDKCQAGKDFDDRMRWALEKYIQCLAHREKARGYKQSRHGSCAVNLKKFETAERLTCLRIHIEPAKGYVRLIRSLAQEEKLTGVRSLKSAQRGGRWRRLDAWRRCAEALAVYRVDDVVKKWKHHPLRFRGPLPLIP